MVYLMEHPNLKWMRTGGTPFSGNLHIDNYGTKSPDGEMFFTRESMATPSVHWAQHDMSALRWMISIPNSQWPEFFGVSGPKVHLRSC
jgi:hypothetical protein